MGDKMGNRHAASILEFTGYVVVRVGVPGNRKETYDIGFKCINAVGDIDEIPVLSPNPEIPAISVEKNAIAPIRSGISP